MDADPHPRDPTLLALLRGIATDLQPAWELTWLALQDWLEERGDPRLVAVRLVARPSAHYADDGTRAAVLMQFRETGSVETPRRSAWLWREHGAGGRAFTFPLASVMPG